MPDWDAGRCSTVEFNYYYGAQADQFSFIRIPKIMLTEDTFSSLSIAAKVLYGVLLDRMTLSRKNGWLDEENRVFIIYQIGEIQEELGFSKKKAMDLLSELETFGLLEKKRRGHGLPNILYVKSFLTGIVDPHEEQDASAGEKTGDRGGSFGTSDGKRGDSRSAGFRTSRSADFGTQEVPISAPQEVPFSAPLKNKTDINQTECNDITSDLIVSGDVDEMRSDSIDTTGMCLDECSLQGPKAYEQLIRENISYEDLLTAHPDEEELIRGIADLILETVISGGESIVIASNIYPAAVVKSRFLKLRFSHVEYVLECLERNTSKVNNIKKYLLAALFNATATFVGYYQAEVNYSMGRRLNGSL